VDGAYDLLFETTFNFTLFESTLVPKWNVNTQLRTRCDVKKRAIMHFSDYATLLATKKLQQKGENDIMISHGTMLNSAD
jgi:hypothetical protein